MICLGIESTAHTFGAGIVTEKGKVLANIKDTYTTQTGGIHPTLAKEHHLKVAQPIIEQAIAKAKIDEKDISFISFSQGPGLSPCLLVGIKYAKEFSYIYYVIIKFS